MRREHAMLSARMFILSLLVLLSGAACGNNDSTTDAGSSENVTSDATVVTADNIAFEPTTVEFEPGADATLALVNEDDVEHSLTSDSDEIDFDVEAEAGESAEGTISLPDADGTYPFICRYHPDSMQMELVVGGGGEAPSSPQGDNTEGPEDTGEGAEENDDGY